ncbi:MAG: glycosyltransferase [Planctomycetaceae bacterium]
MAHFGIVCPCVFGHFNPMATLGRELIRRGHRVTFLGFVDLREQVLEAGLEFAPFGERDFAAGALHDTNETLGRMHGAAARRYTIDWYRRIFSTVLREGPSAMRSLDLDGHITDQTTICSAAVAELLEIPCVSVCNALLYEQHPDVPPGYTPWRFRSSWWSRLRNRIGYWAVNREVRPVFDLLYQFRRQWNLEVESNPTAVYRLLATISQQPPGFEFPRPDLHGAFHFTGPLRDDRSHYEVDFPFETLNGRPLVYASMGTLQNRVPDVFRRVAKACADLDVQLVMSVGGPKDGLDDLPGDPIVVEFAPQLELIRKATLVITHAGMNTTLDALSHAVPMVAIPVTNEQPAIAARVAYRNCGRVVPFRKLTVPRLKSAVETVLRDPAYRRAAHVMRRNTESAGGVRRAADIVERAISTGRPVLNEWRLDAAATLCAKSGFLAPAVEGSSLHVA